MKFSDWVDVWNNSIVCTEQWQCAKWRFIFVTYYWIWTVCFWYEFVDYTNHVVSDISMEECDAVLNGPAEHTQLTQKHFSTYEQWPVKCCGVHWDYLSSKTDSSCASVYIICCSVEVLQLFYRKHLMTLLTLLILFAGSTSKTVMRDIKAFFFFAMSCIWGALISALCLFMQVTCWKSGWGLSPRFLVTHK